MSTRRALVLFFSVIISVVARCSGDASFSIEALAARSRDGVIKLDDESFSMVVPDVSVGKYSLFVLFIASNIKTADPGMTESFQESFSAAGNTWRSQHGEQESVSPVFFCTMDLANSNHVFQALEIPSVPHLRYLSKENLVKGAECDFNDIDGSPESLLSCLDWLHSPGSSSTKWPMVWILVGPALILFGVGIFLYGAWIFCSVMPSLALMTPSALLFCVLALAVYLVSISGTMFVVINKMPFYAGSLSNPRTLTVFIQDEMQFGLEGLVAGILYTSCGVALSLLVHFVPHIKSWWGQRLVAFGLEAVCLFCIAAIFQLSAWKKQGA